MSLLGYYNYTVLLTYIGMLAGFYGITRAIDGDILGAIICLMIAGVCDMFDGAVASTMKRTQEERTFGIEIDSLSDLICFGVLPAVIGYVLNKESEMAVFLAGIYALSALVRLAYFNVDEQIRQHKTSGRRKLYYGMPVTMSALLLPAVFSFVSFFSVSSLFVMTLLVAMAVLFLVPIPIRKPGIIGKAVMVLFGLGEAALVCFLGLIV